MTGAMGSRIAIVVGLMLIVGCATTSPPPVPLLTATPSSGLQSDIINFTLENLTISVGTMVTWTNRDGASHTSTSGVSPNKDGIWDSPILNQGQQFSFDFNQPGVFPYWCRVHPYMVATVTVEG